jgi:hypothetical protein
MAQSETRYGETVWGPDAAPPPAAILYLRNHLLNTTAHSRPHFAVQVEALRLLNHPGAAVCFARGGLIGWARRHGNRVESGVGLETMPALVEFGYLTRGR